MRTLWTLYRRFIVALIVVIILAVSSAVVLVGSHRGHSHGGASVGGLSSSPKTRTMTTTTPSRHLVPSSTAKVPETAIQRQIDTELAQAETPAAIAAALRVNVPMPGVSAAYPTIATAGRADPNAYAIAFAAELLDTNFARQSRGGLLAWAEHEEAPNTLPGVPATVAGKSLVLSLADPNLPGGSPSPVPSVAGWVADAEEGVTQRVADVQAEVDPAWTQIISQGWQPRDPLMTIETVTGTMTVVTNGVAARPESFSLVLMLGSASHVRAGYGAVAAADWTLD